MKEHVNFYENVAEARIRLHHTVILYDKKPYYVLAISDHKQDGILRIYLDPLGPDHPYHRKVSGIPYDWHDEPNMKVGDKMDAWMDANPSSPIIRKMMNSPAFNKFRPFKLGMMNYGDTAMYIERSPMRHTQQGLTNAMIQASPVDLSKGASLPQKLPITVTTPEIFETIEGIYPAVDECLSKLKGNDFTNKSVAFSRDFALAKGPLGVLFLVYRTNVAGVLPNFDRSRVMLPTVNAFLKEAVEESKVFREVCIY